MEKPSKEVRLRVAAIVVRDEEILLVRHLKAGHSYWMLPGGGVAPGESLTDALVRELIEEACVQVQPEHLVLANDSIPPDAHRHIVNLYVTAAIVSGAPRVGADPRVAEVAFLPLVRLSEITLYPDFGGELLAAIRNGFPNRAQYLGNLWKE